MSQAEAPQTTFASGRYSKRKRTQVNYRMEELDVDETDFESEEDITKPKVRRTLTSHSSDTDKGSEATQDGSIQTALKTHDLSLPRASGGNP
jgi:hypothetical protein